MPSTREEIYSYLEKITRNFPRNFNIRDFRRHTANDISEALNISRNLASQYLNELVKEKRVIKVNSRPVYFFHKKNVERSTQTVFDVCVFSSREEFVIKCLEKETKHDFQKVIGFYLSLSSCVEQLKAAVQYPPHGLPVLLYGANGTGKSFLSRMMFEYGKNEKVIGKDKLYLAVDCTEYKKDPETFARNLCGTAENPGWLGKANGGMLFFDEADALAPSSQELLFGYLSTGQYRPAGASERNFSSTVRLVFASSRPPEEVLMKALARRIPISIQLPSLNERTADEKEEMLVAFLKAEGRRMGVDVAISSKAFRCMLEYPYENNIDELKACVTSCCASAYLEKDPEGIAIHMYHLPDYMLFGLKLEQEREEERLIHLNQYSRDTSWSQGTQYFQLILDGFQDFENNCLSFDELLDGCQQHLKDFYDYLLYGQKMVNTRISTYEQLINQTFENIGGAYGISLSKKYSHLLARCLDIQMRENHFISLWYKNNEKEVGRLLQLMCQNLTVEARISAQILGLIKQNLDVEASSLNHLFLLLSIKSQNQKIPDNGTAGVILSHGYATATSIADAANQIIGRKVFDAIDMPLNMSSRELAVTLEKHIERYVTCRDLVLMVDMGSLEQIYEEVKGLDRVNIGIINNISTALAVDIGIGISSNMEMEAVLKRASESNVCMYRVISNLQREEAILFSGENGTDTTERIRDLILKSAGSGLPLQLIVHDYYRLVKNGSQDGVFSKYKVKAIIGLFNPEIRGIPFIALEDIISMEAAGRLEHIFSEYLDEKQMAVFGQNLVKNFSLQNVVESITILNPDKLLDEVEQSVFQLQRITGRVIDSRIMIGLYVHLCCLVERLVTKTSIECYQGLEEFERQHGDFISQVRECFQDISSHYRVELPVSEIAYIYDYINLSNKRRAADQSLGNSREEDE